MKFHSILLATACTFCASAVARTVTYDVGLFDQLVQMGDINVVFKSHPDSVGLVTYYSDNDYSDAIEISNTKGRLLIKEVPDHELGELPTLHAYCDILYQIKSEGKGEVTATIGAATPTLSVNLVGNGRIVCQHISCTDLSASITTGNGTIALQGKCTDANFKLTGTGTIQADRLKAQNVKCTTMGTGTIGCDPIKTLETRGLGATKIYYSGSPTIKKIGNAKLFPIEESPREQQPAAESTNADHDAPVHIITKGDVFQTREPQPDETETSTGQPQETEELEATEELPTTEEETATEVIIDAEEVNITESAEEEISEPVEEENSESAEEEISESEDGVTSESEEEEDEDENEEDAEDPEAE